MEQLWVNPPILPGTCMSTDISTCTPQDDSISLNVMTLLSLLLLLLLTPSFVEAQNVFPGEKQYVSELSFDGREFTSAFNATADRTRLVLVFSPT